MPIQRVLIIDDDEISQMVLSYQVEDILHAETIIVKENGEQALRFLEEAIDQQSELPQLIFLDLNMPQLSGYDFIKLYEEKYATHLPDTHLVILTSSIRKKDEEMTKQYPSVAGFYRKPLEEAQIKEILAAAESN
ncbi:response regulator [Catalinimonas niigatensis]|uniref:response regulator n=1 Tax=Catalinimonas niigatensis TaxID=1397264 RepID=UPI0026654114|nr:response regulator [Catalinimonas niigatensis]WPP48862.1 response regulator [Catalinimonas niigatensis]